MKGTEWEIILVAFVFMILFVSIFAIGIFGRPRQTTTTTTNTEENKYCKIDLDCVIDVKATGERCLLVYPGDFIPFCGCLTSQDCKEGSCDSYNKCS